MVAALTDLDTAPPGTAPVDKVYFGHRSTPAQQGGRGNAHVDVVENGRRRPLPHRPGGPSPDGFEWGYGGSGPAETARCILWDYLGHEPDRGLYQLFKRSFIAPAPVAGFRLSAVEIEAWLVLAGAREVDA